MFATIETKVVENFEHALWKILRKNLLNTFDFIGKIQINENFFENVLKFFLSFMHNFSHFSTHGVKTIQILLTFMLFHAFRN